MVVDPHIEELRRIAPDLAPSIAKLTVPAYILDRNGVVRWLNAAAIAHFGDLRGKRISQIVERDYVTLARQEFAAKILGTVEASEGSIAVRTVDGRRVGVEVSSTTLLEHGSIVGVFGLADPEEERSEAVARHGARDTTADGRAPAPRARPFDGHHRGEARYRDGDGPKPRPGDPRPARSWHPSRSRHAGSRARPPLAPRLTQLGHDEFAWIRESGAGSRGCPPPSAFPRTRGGARLTTTAWGRAPPRRFPRCGGRRRGRRCRQGSPVARGAAR